VAPVPRGRESVTVPARERSPKIVCSYVTGPGTPMPGSLAEPFGYDAQGRELGPG
jgi:hypothetical protein